MAQLNSHSIDLESGSNQYLSVADSASLSITGDLTIECWIKIESIGADVKGIVSKVVVAGNQISYALYYNEVTDKLQLDISNDGINSDTHISNALGFTTGIWYHIAVTFDASEATTIFYKNGVAAGGETKTRTAIFDSTAAFQIGARDTTKYWDGLIDEVRVWNTIRTGAQIAANLGTEIGTDSNLKGYWKLNNVLTDSSGNGATLTNNGSAVFSTDSAFAHLTDSIDADDSFAAPTRSFNLSFTDALSLLSRAMRRLGLIPINQHPYRDPRTTTTTGTAKGRGRGLKRG
jgi:hypothetical protein